MSNTHEIFIFGLANSLHCAGMCGPLCVGVSDRFSGIAAYHAARVASYALVGAVAGAIGNLVIGPDSVLPTGWISIGLAVVLVIGVTGLVRLPTNGRMGQFAVKGLRRAYGWPATSRGLGLGLLTPLLPCGILYVVVAMALVEGRAAGGALVLVTFAAGSLPALLFVQGNARWLKGRLSPVGRRRLFQVLMLVSAGVLAYRGVLEVIGSSCCH